MRKRSCSSRRCARHRASRLVRCFGTKSAADEAVALLTVFRYHRRGAYTHYVVKDGRKWCVVRERKVPRR